MRRRAEEDARISRYARLSLADRSNLRIERPESPAHIAGLCVVEARPLLDADGELEDEASLLDAAELLFRPLLDRSRSLWEVWFLTGLEGAGWARRAWAAARVDRHPNTGASGPVAPARPRLPSGMEVCDD